MTHDLIGKKLVIKNPGEGEVTADMIRATFGAGPNDMQVVILSPDFVYKNKADPKNYEKTKFVVLWDLNSYVINEVIDTSVPIVKKPFQYRVTRARRDWVPGTPHPGYDVYEDGKLVSVVSEAPAEVEPSLVAEIKQQLKDHSSNKERTAEIILDHVMKASAQGRASLDQVITRIPLTMNSRFILTFDWQYGTERVDQEFESAEDSKEYLSYFKKLYPWAEIKNARTILETFSVEIVETLD